MARYRDRLPQLESGLFLTDGGLETWMVFKEGFDLPCFAAFDLLRRPEGRVALADYYRRHADIARAAGLGFILDTVTWRASRDWGAKLGYSPADIAAANRDAVNLLEALRAEFETPASPMPIDGCIGPRGDGYIADMAMTAEEAEAYHGEQIRTFADTAADFVSAITMTNAPEAAGIARAAAAIGMPVVISFTVETDGRLPSGQPLADAIAAVDAESGAAPAYYMINCAHPDHFAATLDSGAPELRRLRGLRANASRLSHAELDAASELDEGSPSELGGQYAVLRQKHPQIVVVGGCCGTDHRHVSAICHACHPSTRAA